MVISGILWTLSIWKQYYCAVLRAAVPSDSDTISGCLWWTADGGRARVFTLSFNCLARWAKILASSVLCMASPANHTSNSSDIETRTRAAVCVRVIWSLVERNLKRTLFMTMSALHCLCVTSISIRLKLEPHKQLERDFSFASLR